ncbi:MAG: UDP-N-acetylglucosamine 1-carboxyvinyltransferase [Candidatus Paceibacterota bacterium]
MKKTSKKSVNKLSLIGSLIQQLREEKNLTQSELAKRIGSTQSAIARIEKGEQNISTDLLSKISNALERDIVQVSDGSLNIEIEGGVELSGEIVTRTSKNAAVALLFATLLNTGKTTLIDVPKIEEVNRIIEVLTSVGVKAVSKGNTLEITVPPKLSLNNINTLSAEKTRSIIMMIGPLLHRYPTFSVPRPGGCKLGSRSVHPHFLALESFGAKITESADSYSIATKKITPADVTLYETGDTVTENALMAAATSPGVTTIRYASANYQVQELCFFLEKLGVTVEGIGSSTLVVHGLEKIHTDVTYHLAEDPIDSMFFIATAITTKSNITIKRAPIRFLELELLKLKTMGLSFTVSKPYLSYNNRTELVDIVLKKSKLTALPDKIECRPYPGLNIDNLPFFALIATQAHGQTMLHDWVYEKRAIHYKELDKLGADTVLLDPHRILIQGPTALKPAEVICPPALRPGAIILIGMLGAKGRSILRNIYSINRGYEDIIKRLNSLGAKVQILREK